jgi:hypothetical protein
MMTKKKAAGSKKKTSAMMRGKSSTLGSTKPPGFGAAPAKAAGKGARMLGAKSAPPNVAKKPRAKKK